MGKVGHRTSKKFTAGSRAVSPVRSACPPARPPPQRPTDRPRPNPLPETCERESRAEDWPRAQESPPRSSSSRRPRVRCCLHPDPRPQQPKSIHNCPSCRRRVGELLSLGVCNPFFYSFMTYLPCPELVFYIPSQSQTTRQPKTNRRNFLLSHQANNVPSAYNAAPSPDLRPPSSTMSPLDVSTPPRRPAHQPPPRRQRQHLLLPPSTPPSPHQQARKRRPRPRLKSTGSSPA